MVAGTPARYGRVEGAGTEEPDRGDRVAVSTLQLRELHKEFPGGFHAVRGVSAPISDGEFVAIVGPSGCGKTSVLRMIAGLESVTSGEVVIDGVPVNDDTPQQRDIAMAFQQHALYPHLTAEQNIGFSLRIAGLHRREIAKRVRPLADQLGLSDLLDRRPSKLSGGQQQRVAMARAIIRDPRLFLMDEPLSNLDAKLRTEARAMILSIQQRLQATTVYVTHDQLEAMSMADRVLVMRHGEVVQRGAPIDVYRYPVDLFVGAFMGSPGMCVVLGRAAPTGAGGVLVRIGSHSVHLPDGSFPSLGRTLGATGRDVAVGIRPEAVRLDPDGNLELSVDTAESLGHDWLVHLVIDAPAVTVTEDGSQVVISDHPFSTLSLLAPLDERPGLWAPIRVGIAPDGLHLFDLESGKAIAHGTAPRVPVGS